MTKSFRDRQVYATRNAWMTDSHDTREEARKKSCWQKAYLSSNIPSRKLVSGMNEHYLRRLSFFDLLQNDRSVWKEREVDFTLINANRGRRAWSDPGPARSPKR